MRNSSACIRGIAALAFSLGLTAAACAAYPDPSIPLRIVVGFPPGGGADILGRVVQPKLAKVLDTNVIIENRPGASGVIATSYVARAKPDGYTLYIATPGSLTMLPNLQSVPYDPATDLAPISLLVTMPNVLVTYTDSPLKSVADLIALAKSGKDVTYASGGVGTIGQMAAEEFNLKAGLHIRQVPYKGTTPALNDVASGLVNVTFSDPSVKALIAAGRLRALAVTTAQPSAQFPGVPTVAQAGLPGYQVMNWYGVMAPAGLPADVMKKLNAAFVTTMADPDVKQRLSSASGMDATSSTPQAFATLLTNERAKWGNLIKEAHITLN